MLVVLDADITVKHKAAVWAHLEARRYHIRELTEAGHTVLGAIGVEELDPAEVEQLVGVSRVVVLSKPDQHASGDLRREASVVQAGRSLIGGGRLTVIAGPPAVASQQQIHELAATLAASGAAALRATAFRPAGAPAALPELGAEGLLLLRQAGDTVGLPTVSELSSHEHLPVFAELVDVVEIGARNMQNFELLGGVGELGKPVLLRRGVGTALEELLLAAEYLLAHGTDAVLLGEGASRAVAGGPRNTFDVAAVPAVKRLCQLPIVVDPTHAFGGRDEVAPLALAGLAAGADGLIVEVHPDPERVGDDGRQALLPQQFEKLMRDIDRLAQVLKKQVQRGPSIFPPAPIAAVTTPGVRVAYPGEPGAHTENAVRRHFADPEPVPSREFADVFRLVLSGGAAFGAIPIENTLSGSIHENYDLLLQFPDVHIVGEVRTRIVWCLIGTPGAALDGVTTLISHPQGIAQCTRFLDQYLSWERMAYYDTAGAVARVAADADPRQVALASPAAAREYGMQILVEGVETNAENYTRFFVIAPGAAATDIARGANRASLVFSTLDEAGSLFRALQVLADRRLNMTKLESRPIPGRPWEYMFYVDLDVDSVAAFQSTVQSLRAATASYRLLGLYNGGSGGAAAR
jgi:3-deoxy-7-phosphoheptulonate synthase